MTLTRAYLGIGSNKNKPLQQVNQAITTLQKLPRLKFIGVSSRYRSPPLGPSDQADFVNAVAAVDTQLSATALLKVLQAIEQQQGRVRTQHWGARTLDLDLLLYGNEIVNTAELVIPHAEMRNRYFVLYPLAEIAPELVFPDGETLRQCLATLSANDLVKIDTVP